MINLPALRAAELARGDPFVIVLNSDGSGRVATWTANDVIGDPVYTFGSFAELEGWMDEQIAKGGKT